MRKRKLRTGLSAVTAAMLVSHMVLGCCWHHAHCCTDECRPTTAVALPGECHDRDGDACGTSQRSGHDHRGHHGRHECQGGSCVFLRTSRVNVPHLAVVVALPASLVCPSDGLTVVAGPVRPCFDCDDLLPPVRRHLLDQVLLI
ncbi:MAG: hypothetical protein ABFC96_12955 [Thermoguttaceae bacterium]